VLLTMLILAISASASACQNEWKGVFSSPIDKTDKAITKLEKCLKEQGGKNEK